MKLTVEADASDPRTFVYRLSGDLHGPGGGWEFQEAVRQRFADGVRRMIIDLSSVHRIDSCGIGIIAAISMSAQNAGAGLVLSALPPRIEQVLGVTKFLHFVDHAETMAEARDKLDAMSPEDASD